MTRFPSDSNLYLDDDTVVRIDGLHEPRKERVQRLTQKILQAWKLQQYESCYSLLVEFDRLSGSLPPELNKLRKRMPAKRHLQHLRQIRSEATSMIRDGMHDSAYALCEIEKEEFDQADAEDQEAIDIEFRLILLLRQTILANWHSSVKQEITELLQTCSQESVQNAQNILDSLEGKPLFEGTSGFYYDLHNAVKNAWYKFYVQEAKKTHSRKAWKQAIVWASKAQQICADCSDLNRIVEQCHTALQVRRRIAWAVSGCIVVFLVVTPFMYLQHLKSEFLSCLERHDFKPALKIAYKISFCNKGADSYIRFMEYFKEVGELYNDASNIVGAEIHPLWTEWRMQLQEDLDGWKDVRDHHAIAERFHQAIEFYREILDSSTLLYLDNLHVGSECLIKYRTLDELKEIVLADSFPMLVYPSEYRITVSHVDYFTATFSLHRELLASRPDYELNVSLKPRDGTLTINTPNEAMIYQGGSFVGTTGRTLCLKAEKSCTLRLRAEGYKDKVVNIRLKPNQKLTRSYTMEVAEGELRIELYAGSNIPSEMLPKKVYVRLNNERSELETSLSRSMALDIGAYKVLLRVPGWKVVRPKSVKIQQNMLTIAHFPIEPEKTTVQFDSDISSSIWLGKKRIGETGSAIEVIPGTHTYTLKSHMCRDVSISLLSYPGQTDRRDVKMTSFAPATVVIRAYGTKGEVKAKVYEGDKYIGRTGQQFSLAPGIKHVLKVTARGYNDLTVTTTVKPNVVYGKPIVVKMTKKEKKKSSIMRWAKEKIYY